MPKVKIAEYVLRCEGSSAVCQSLGTNPPGLKCKNFVRLVVLGAVWLAQAASPPDQPGDVSKWASFVNRAGWSIKYPSNFRVGSCRQCPDPASPNVFVTFSDPSTAESIMIERLADKPADQTVDKWLQESSHDTVANLRVNDEWIYLDGMPALKVKNRKPDSGESESVYIVNGSKTFAIRASSTQTRSFYLLYRQMLSTFRFADTAKNAARPTGGLAR
jgi:hypothetical protein